MADILIVEDGVRERERLCKLFESSDYSVKAVESVSEAERLLSVEQFRLAFLDIGLGDRSGSHLFELIKSSSSVPFVVILTGNPSVHLKQRFMDEGAAAYIVKASDASSNQSLLHLASSLLGTEKVSISGGIPLSDFLRQYVNEASRTLFLDTDEKLPACSACASEEFVVTFEHKTQLPPEVEGLVVCAHCGKALDPEIG